MTTPAPEVRAFFDRPTGSLQYVFHDAGTMKGAIVDPVWNFSPKSAALTSESADEICRYVQRAGIDIEWILDTHPHADHFTAAHLLSERLNAPRAIGERTKAVQSLWKELYNLGDDFHTDGRQWDRLLADGDSFPVGGIEVRAMFTPGHTMASISYIAGDAAFIGDTLMMPESGTTRADFPGGDAQALWQSIRDILALPDATRLYIGHDYPADDKAAQYMATVLAHRLTNRHVRDGIGRDEFLSARTARDETLDLPARMLAAMQVNLRGGQLPAPESDGHVYLKIPVNRLKPRS